MNPYLEIIRPSVCLMTVLGLLVGGIVSGSVFFPVLFVFAAIAAFLICAGGDVINDYFDYKIDKISMPHRPIPSGKISRNTAIKYFFLLSFLGMLFAYFVRIEFFIIALINFFISSTYSWKLKRIVLIKNIAVSWLAASAFLAAGLIIGDFHSLIGSALLILVLISFLATMSREILKDIRDAKGDISVKIHTLPMVIGKKWSKILAYSALFIACVLLLVPYFQNMFGSLYLIGVVPAILICIYSITLKIQKAEKLVKVAMYFVFLGFILGSLF